MCCFSKVVQSVSGTSIFARSGKEGRQFLVYSMTLKSSVDVAMILPIPTLKGSSEDAVKFLNLEKYPEFFVEMANGFPAPPTNRTKGPAQGSDHALTLKVVEVGSFVASFVPSVKDFARVDEQFKLPASIWDKLPQYADYGFAVFQLKKGEKKVHPMAFDFPRANPKKLFFPTVHIHDGKVSAKANFDHALYAQTTGQEQLVKWEESTQLAKQFMTKLDESHGIVVPGDHVYKLSMVGSYKNEDLIV